MAKLTIGNSYQVRDKYTSVTVTDDQLTVDLDPVKLIAKPAVAIAAAIKRGILSNSATTADGKRRLFVRTGTLAAGITALPSGEIVAPPGYLQDPALVDRLRAVVPALANPLDDPQVKAAIDATADTIHRKGR